MTIRAVILGMVGGVLIGGLGYINDQVLGLESINAGHLLPVSVFMFMLLGVALVSPVWLFKPSWRFRPGELAVAMALMMVGSSLPARGLMERFTPALSLPMHYNEQMPGWKQHGILRKPDGSPGYVPPQMLTGDAKYDPEVMRGLFQGLGTPGKPISPADVPWHKWRRPLVTWLPMILLVATAVICLGLIVHRQWAWRERLRYPIAELATSLLQRGPGDTPNPIFRNKIFWIGLGAIFSIHAINGLHQWYPESIQVPLRFDFVDVFQKYPGVQDSPWGLYLLRVTIYPTIIAFSFFLSSDIALSFGITQLLFVPIGAILMAYGIDVSLSGQAHNWQRFGSYFAFSLILLYIGRRYYWQLLKQALSFRRQEGVLTYQAWACRIFLLAVTGLFGMFCSLGLDWPLAALIIGLILLMVMMVSRISAETGMFYIDPRWPPVYVLIGLFGTYAMGPKAIVITAMLASIFAFDPCQSLMPYFVNALKACDNLGVKPPRLMWWTGATYAAGLALAIVVVLWANYNFGFRETAVTTHGVPTGPYNLADKSVAELSASGELAASESLSPLERLSNLRPEEGFVWWAGIGFVLVLIMGAMRLRFSWWPLHPVLFLVWATWPMAQMSHSFLLGWIIKVSVTRIGGYKSYRTLKPLMIGVIVGDLLGAGLWMAVGAIYYGLTGLIPTAERYMVFPW